MAHLSLSLLGGFKITLDGQPVTAFGTDKARALLAYLAVESDRPHRRATLAGLLWPELPQERAAHNLRQSLVYLRRALREDKATTEVRSSFLLLSGQEIQFNPLSDCALDVADFSELIRAFRQHQHPAGDLCPICTSWLHQATDLYRGDFLLDLAVRDSLPFEEWQVFQREALHRQAVEALRRMTDYYERQGNPTKVLEYTRRLLTLEPWQEFAQLQLMAALAQTGQETAALEQYAVFSKTLAREFGIEVSPEVKALYDQIRSRSHSKVATVSGPDRRAEFAESVSNAPDERRQVTALLCQWQAPAGKIDPEDVQEGLVRFGRYLSEITARYGGRQPQQLGAEFLVYFGYPLSQENTAWHAVSAALALIAAARDRDHVRIGIHTGLMVVSGNELAGNVADIARNCLRLGEVDSIMLTESTERLIREAFICQPIGLTGSSEPALLYRVQGKNADQDRSVWRSRSKQVTPLIGRTAELKQLAVCLERMPAGHGQIITVCGEPGIGKTRLTREFKRMCAMPATWLESRCSPTFQNTNLHPLIDLLEQLLGIERNDRAAFKREKLLAVLTRHALDQPDTIWLLSMLLSLPVETPAPRAVTENQRERMREAFLTLFQHEAAHQPLMLLIEDLHWADPTTIAWLNRSLDALAAVPCVLWLNWRPEFVAPWPPKPYLLSLNLNPLTPLEAASLIDEVAGLEMLPAEVCQQIVRQADGVPLFLEELTQTLLVQSLESDFASLRAAQVPVTLRDSLTARLDRIGAAKETARWAATLGREFSYPVLQAVVPFAEQRLQHDLTILIDANLIVVRGERPYRNYAFKHALIQEAAYDSLLKRTRQDYHQQVALTMANHFPHIAETQPEILAQHFSQAGLLTEAADYWLCAGERSVAQGATLEARTFFDHALAAIKPDDHERRWQALLGRETALDYREERAAQRNVLEALLQLAETLDDDVRRTQALLRQTYYANRTEDYQLMLRASTAASLTASRQNDRALQAQAMASVVTALARLERWPDAQPIVEALLAMLPDLVDEAVRGSVFSDVALYYSDLGDIARALQLRLQGVAIAHRLNQRGLETRHLANIGMSYARLGLYAEGQAALENGLALAESIGDRIWQIICRYDLCYVQWSQNNRDSARALGERALQELRAGGYRPLAVATCLFYLGLIHEEVADYSTAVTYLAESRTLYADGGQHGCSMEAQAVEARCLLALGRCAEAQRLAVEVWDYVRRQGTVTIDFPARVFLCLADVLAQTSAFESAEQEVLQAGYADLMRTAEGIDDAKWRQAFLEEERSNRALLSRWESVNSKVPG